MDLAETESRTAFVSKERYKLCPGCGNFVGYLEKDVFCMLCGERLLEACPHCQEPVIYPIAKFCPACGQQLVKAKRAELA